MRRIAVGVAFVTSLLLAQRAEASFHVMDVVEVFAGSPANPNAQYVVIQMYSGGQNLVGGHSITVFNAANANIGTFTFVGNVAVGDDQSKILIATTQAMSLFNVTPNLTMTAIIPAAGGKVCFDTIDCVGWGTYAPVGGDQVVSPAVAIAPGRALVRKLNIAGGATTLDPGDDRGNSQMDFALGAPAPVNNAGVAGTPPSSTCGMNGLEGLEQCDDGNTASGDGCSATCFTESCGDGTVNLAGEVCDDGNTVNGDGCDNNCTITACRNGVVAGTEACDDGNNNNGDGCDNNCTITGCGNNVMTGTEACDDGNLTSGDGCDANCTITGCGNNIVTAGESCDPPNGTTCSATCQQQCASPADCTDTDLCTMNETCVTNACQVTPVSPDDNEPCTMDSCDSATGVHHAALQNGMSCTRPTVGGPGLCIAGACVAASCGDGFIEAGVEQCDDGNAVDTDACTNACTTPRCGDSLVQTGEECDDGNAVDNDGCTAICAVERCGDAVVQANEECDDANMTPEDGCSATCKNERCGDGVVQVTEDCDDGNTTNADACTTLCTAPRCGDGLVSGGEACDDGNDVATDDCDRCAVPGGDDGGGCCETSPNAAPSGMLLALGLVLALRRRRRQE